MELIKTIFNTIIMLIYICNISELIGHRISQKGKRKELIGIEIFQIITVSSYTLHLIAKSV